MTIYIYYESVDDDNLKERVDRVVKVKFAAGCLIIERDVGDRATNTAAYMTGTPARRLIPTNPYDPIVIVP